MTHRRDSESQLQYVRAIRERELHQLHRERLAARPGRRHIRRALGRSLIRVGDRLAAESDHPRARRA